MPFDFIELAIPDVILIESRQFGDDRGVFMELYKQSEFHQHGICEQFVQDNYSQSRQGVLRGLHYQLSPIAQAKIVRTFHGKIFDVAVDLRQGSPYFGQWVGQVLDASSSKALYIPAGFAHGFQVISETAKVFYKVSGKYAPELERGIVWDDPTLDIQWPIAEPILSNKDSGLPNFKAAEYDFAYSN